MHGIWVRGIDGVVEGSWLLRPDKDRAMELLRFAASQGSSEALTMLGHMLAGGSVRREAAPASATGKSTGGSKRKGAGAPLTLGDVVKGPWTERLLEVLVHMEEIPAVQAMRGSM